MRSGEVCSRLRHEIAKIHQDNEPSNTPGHLKFIIIACKLSHSQPVATKYDERMVSIHPESGGQGSRIWNIWYIAETASTEPTKHGLHLVPSFTLPGSMTLHLICSCLAHWLPRQSARWIFWITFLLLVQLPLPNSSKVSTSYLLLQSWAPELFW